jgi:hypothetical protein
MPTRLPGRRAVGRGGNLKPREKAQIEEWFIEGFSVMEVYAQCLDNGIEPPVEQALYRILNSESVQTGLRERKALEAKSRIARIAARTAERQDILDRIKTTVGARAEEYTGFVPGGESGLVVLSDKKTIRTGVEGYDTVDIYKTDAALLEQWRGVLADQEKADEALRRNLRFERDRTRMDERHDQESELREQTGEIREIEKQKLQLELDLLTKAPEGSYQPPTFPEVILERLPDPVRPASADVPDTEEQEAATPEIPWILEDMEKPASQEGATEALEQ